MRRTYTGSEQTDSRQQQKEITVILTFSKQGLTPSTDGALITSQYAEIKDANM